MNTNISALQTLVEALEQNDYVTSVSPVYVEGVAIGYTISFSKSRDITIYHGVDDGEEDDRDDPDGGPSFSYNPNGFAGSDRFGGEPDDWE